MLTAPASPGPIVSCRCQALFITPCHCQASRSLGRRQASDRCACTCRGTSVTHVSFQWPFLVWPLSGPFVSSRCQALRVPALAVVRQVWHIGDLCFKSFAVVRPVWSRRCLLLDSYFTFSVTQLAVVRRCVSPPCRCQASMAHR